MLQIRQEKPYYQANPELDSLVSIVDQVLKTLLINRRLSAVPTFPQRLSILKNFYNATRSLIKC